MTVEATSIAVRRGRPRDPEVDQAILSAARLVLAKNGFSATSMGEIARTAGVGKDTLYRRWDSKAALVGHLLAVMAAENVPVPAEEDPTYALFLFLQDIVRVNVQSDFGAIVAGVVGESARNEQLSTAFRRFWLDRRAIAAQLVREVTGSAADDDQLEVILDHVLGPIYYRLLLTGSAVDDHYLWNLVLAIPTDQTQNTNDSVGGNP